MLIKDQVPSLIRLSKRYMQTVPVSPVSKIAPTVFGSLPSSSVSESAIASSPKSWASHSLPDKVGVSRTTRPFARPFVAPKAPEPAPQPVKEEARPAKPKRVLRPRKAAIKLTPKAVMHVKALLDSPTPKMIRIGVRNRGCSGLTYNLEYVESPGKFDEEIVQDGVKVLIDSKALFSIIGSEMDWVDDKLSSRFVFHNPNSKGQCGCGESFMV
jgi:iron-sulfur cluster assembly accessory protein